jgi:hypothetical protein
MSQVKQSKADSKSKKPKEKVAGVKRGNVMRKTLPAESGVIEDVDGHTNREKKNKESNIVLGNVMRKKSATDNTQDEAANADADPGSSMEDVVMLGTDGTEDELVEEDSETDRIGRKKSHARKGRAVERKELTAQIDSGTDEDDV